MKFSYGYHKRLTVMCPPFTYFYLQSFVDLKSQVTSDQWKMIVVGFI